MYASSDQNFPGYKQEFFADPLSIQSLDNEVPVEKQAINSLPEDVTTLMQAVFSSNSAEKGGGIYNYQGDLVLIDAVFQNNEGDYGGGMANYKADTTLINVTMTANHAHDDGGGIANSYLSQLDLANVLFNGNTAESNGGALFNYNSNPLLANITFSGNFAGGYGGGIFNWSDSATIPADPTINNSILWGNEAGLGGPQIYMPDLSFASPTFSFSIVQGSGGSGSTWDTNLGLDGGHNLDADPHFITNPDAGDGNWLTFTDNEYGDLHLELSSPAVDAGNNLFVPLDAFDLDQDADVAEPLPFDRDHQARFYDILMIPDTGNGIPPIVDMGTYETIGETGITNISLNSGWNMISSYVYPLDCDLDVIFAGMTDKMILLKNGLGDVYWPSLGLDEIHCWDTLQGYQIYMLEPATLEISGLVVNETTTHLPLDTGWSLVGYWCDTTTPIPEAFVSIESELLLAKNGAGQIYWPAYGINQIEDMTPTQGYQLYVTSPVTLTYPASSSS